MTKHGDTSQGPTRLDQLLVLRGLAPTRSRARDLILRGQVSVGGIPNVKPSSSVSPGADLSVTAEADDVSRGAIKLRAGLDDFGFSAAEKVCLDIGASTGGFTQALLAAGASRVYAVDVGHGQLAARLASDHRVVNLEGRDARGLDASDIPEPVDAIVADVSFISLAKVLPQVLPFARPGGSWLIALVKPQFELTPGDIGKGGIVRDDAARDRAVTSVRDWMAERAGWRVVDVIPSPIAGGSGNREFLLGARHD